MLNNIHNKMSLQIFIFVIILILNSHTHPTLPTGTPQALLGHQVVHEKRRPAFPEKAPDAFVALASECWAPDAASR